ncbi:hypothetical protein D9M71_411370 [compost metagenome]
MAVGGLGQRSDINDIAGGIADGLAEYRFGTRVDQRFEGGDIVMGREAGVDSHAWQGVRQQVVGAAVQLGHRDDIVAGFGDGLDGVGDSRHTRGDGQRANPAFQGGHALLEHVVGGVHDARIDVAGNLQVKQVGAVLGVVEGEGGGLVDRYGHRLGGRVGAEARMDGKRFQLHAIVP